MKLQFQIEYFYLGFHHVKARTNIRGVYVEAEAPHYDMAKKLLIEKVQSFCAKVPPKEEAEIEVEVDEPPS